MSKDLEGEKMIHHVIVFFFFFNFELSEGATVLSNKDKKISTYGHQIIVVFLRLVLKVGCCCFYLSLLCCVSWSRLHFFFFLNTFTRHKVVAKRITVLY